MFDDDEYEKKIVDFHRRGPELPATIGTSGHADKPDEHDALIVEDAAESLGASYKGRRAGALGDINVISML